MPKNDSMPSIMYLLTSAWKTFDQQHQILKSNQLLTHPPTNQSRNLNMNCCYCQQTACKTLRKMLLEKNSSKFEEAPVFRLRLSDLSKRVDRIYWPRRRVPFDLEQKPATSRRRHFQNMYHNLNTVAQSYFGMKLSERASKPRSSRSEVCDVMIRGIHPYAMLSWDYHNWSTVHPPT